MGQIPTTTGDMTVGAAPTSNLCTLCGNLISHRVTTDTEAEVVGPLKAIAVKTNTELLTAGTLPPEEVLRTTTRTLPTEGMEVI
jgi:hypothetical protein